MKRKYPQILIDIQTFLQQINYISSNEHNEGRRNSQNDEDFIITKLQNKFGNIILPQPKARWWYDFMVIDGNNKYPVNYKSTTLLNIDSNKAGRPDNAGQKIGMLYALTTIPLEETIDKESNKGFKLTKVNSNLGHDIFNTLLKNNKGDSNRDYYYIVQNKTDTSEVLLVGMRDLVISTAGRNSSYNLPFQVDWRDNRNIVPRSFDEAWNHIITMYKNNVNIMINMLETVNAL